MSNLSTFAAGALVSRPCLDPRAHAQYLQRTPGGEVRWTDDPDVATAFGSMRDAMREAMRLPSTLRAFALPRKAELMLHRFQ
jgi:hypothetical protein